MFKPLSILLAGVLLLMAGIFMEVVKEKVRDVFLIRDENENTDFYEYRMNKYEIYQHAFISVSLTMFLIAVIIWAVSNVDYVLYGITLIFGLMILVNYSSDE